MIQAIEVHGWRARVHYWTLLAVARFWLLAGQRHLIFPSVRELGRIFGPNNEADVALDHGIRLRVGLHDPYWRNSLIHRDPEPGLNWFLPALGRAPTLFVDGGANIGLWSLAAEKRLGWNCIAIEAASHLADRLERNRRLSGATFEIRRSAVWKTDGERITFHTDASFHVGGHLDTVAGYPDGSKLRIRESVETVTVDTLVREWKEEHADPARIVIKLDIEGAETAAFAGARKTLADGAILIYEDHGSDTECQTTKAALELGLIVFALETGSIARISSPAEARARKPNWRLGYNFVALRPEYESLLDDVKSETADVS